MNPCHRREVEGEVMDPGTCGRPQTLTGLVHANDRKDGRVCTTTASSDLRRRRWRHRSRRVGLLARTIPSRDSCLPLAWSSLRSNSLSMEGVTDGRSRRKPVPDRLIDPSMMVGHRLFLTIVARWSDKGSV